MRRCAIYARVSTPEQEKHGSSLETQLADCRAYAHNAGYTVALERSDVLSGRTMSRAGLEEVLDAARRGELDVVVCATIDRANRDLADLLMMDRELTQLGVALEFVRDPREHTPQGNLFFQVKGAFAAYEHSMIVERMRKGKMHYIAAGRVINNSHIPYGYRYDPDNRNLYIQEDEAAIVREIYEWIGEGGHSMLSIANRLTARSVPLPQQGRIWRESTVSDLLHNEVYKGTWTYNKRRMVRRPRKPPGEGMPIDPDDLVYAKIDRPRSEWLFVPVPPIVSTELWNAANAQVRRNIALSPRNRKHPYLLAGMIRCGECGRTMYGWKHGNGDSTYYYKCPGYADATKYARSPDACRVKAIRIDALEPAVWGQVLTQFSDPRTVTSLLEGAQEDDDPRLSPTYQLRLTNIERQRTTSEREAARLLDIYLTGDVERDTYIERMAVIKRKMQSLDQEQAELEDVGADYDARIRATHSLEERIEAVRADLPFMQYEDKRALLIALNVSVIVHRASVLKDGHFVDIHNLLQPVCALPVPRPAMRWHNRWAK